MQDLATVIANLPWARYGLDTVEEQANRHGELQALIEQHIDAYAHAKTLSRWQGRSNGDSLGSGWLMGKIGFFFHRSKLANARADRAEELLRLSGRVNRHVMQALLETFGEERAAQIAASAPSDGETL